MIINRIKTFIEYKRLPVSRFENLIGASDGTLRNAIKKGSEINSKWLVLISENFPELNFNWLVTGTGEMLLNKETSFFENIKNENLLDYILINIENFRREPKIDAIAALFSNFEQQRELQKMYDKINEYEDLLDKLKTDSK